MTVDAPPRPPGVDDCDRDDPAEALIKEAKQRARRRRWTYGGAAAAVAIAAVAAFTIPGGPSSPRSAAREVSPRPRPIAPVVNAPEAASTVLSSWGEFHRGYVLIYADGRVLFHYDNGDGVSERHLSARGLKLVHSGQLDAHDLLVGISAASARKLWVKPTTEVWEPSTYALCPHRPVAGGGFPVNASDIVDELPAPVRAMLDGRQHAYQPSIGTAHWPFPWRPDHPEDKGMTDCFELTAAETSTLFQIIAANGFVDQDPIQGAAGWTRVFRYGNLTLAPEPIFPHGQYVLWGA